jgi:drug/metabolite transporter (DMT)-like permease
LTVELLLFAAVAVRIISNPISNVIQKNLTLNLQHPLFVNFLSYLILSLFSLFLLPGHSGADLNSAFWIYSILGGIAGAFGNAFIIKALEKGDLSVLGPINAYKSVVGIIFAFILIGELPNLWGFIGVLLIIAGSYFVLSTGQHKFSWSILKQPAIQFRIAALILTGIQAVFDKKIIQNSDLTMAFASWCISGAIFSYFICLLNSVKPAYYFRGMSRPIAGKYLVLCASIALMTASTNYSFKNMPVGEALALFQISILISVFLGYKIFQEQGLIRKLVGSAIMIAGSLFILLFK